jgi:hypothetical protein
MNKKISSSSFLFLFAGIVAIAIVILAVVNSNPSVGAESFAECLTEKGAKMYGTWWCGHCRQQKELFGAAFSKINYIECSPEGSQEMLQECRDAGIEGYPTWKFEDGSHLGGARSFEDLAEKTGCEILNDEE